MKNVLFAIVVGSFFCLGALAKMADVNVVRIPSSSENIEAQLIKDVDAFIKARINLYPDTEETECFVSKNGNFNCYKSEQATTCPNGPREWSTVEVTGAIVTEGKKRYIEIADLTYRLACFKKN